MTRNKQTSGERIVKDIKRKTRKQYSAEEKIRIVLGWPARGRKCCRALPARRYIPRHLLQMVEGLFGGGQETADWRHCPASQ